MTCDRCGCEVGNVVRHREWHNQMDDIATTANDAAEKADHASKVLHKNHLGI